MIRDGETFAATANALGVPTSTLTTTMHKHGLTARNLRQGSPRLREQFENAVLYYREGLKVAEIIRKTGIPERTFYILLGKQGVPLRQRRQSKGSAEISSQSARLAGPVPVSYTHLSGRCAGLRKTCEPHGTRCAGLLNQPLTTRTSDLGWVPLLLTARWGRGNL